MGLSDMSNIGKQLEKLLEEVGINTIDELKKIGSIEAGIRLTLNNEFCANKLYAMEGAIQNIRWHELPKEYRDELYKKYQESAKQYELK